MKKTYIFMIGVIALMFISTSSSLVNTIIYSIAIVSSVCEPTLA